MSPCLYIPRQIEDMPILHLLWLIAHLNYFFWCWSNISVLLRGGNRDNYTGRKITSRPTVIWLISGILKTIHIGQPLPGRTALAESWHEYHFLITRQVCIAKLSDYSPEHKNFLRHLIERSLKMRMGRVSGVPVLMALNGRHLVNNAASVPQTRYVHPQNIWPFIMAVDCRQFEK